MILLVLLIDLEKQLIMIIELILLLYAQYVLLQFDNCMAEEITTHALCIANSLLTQ